MLLAVWLLLSRIKCKSAPEALFGYPISFGVKIFEVNFRVNLGVDFWGLLNDLFSYYETRKKSILVNIELYNVDEQIKNHFY